MVAQRAGHREAIAKRAWKQAREFNAAVPVGTDVLYMRDDGTYFPTRTRSEAWALGDHTPVVLVDGIAGGVHTVRIHKV